MADNNARRDKAHTRDGRKLNVRPTENELQPMKEKNSSYIESKMTHAVDRFFFKDKRRGIEELFSMFSLGSTCS